jgi:hypothetical protein
VAAVVAQPAKKDRTNLWVIISLVAIAGISATVWAMTRQKKDDPWNQPSPPSDQPGEPGTKPDEPSDKPEPPKPPPPADPAKDPWSSNAPSIGTMAGTPMAGTAPNGLVPDGARLIPPTGFTTTSGPGPAGQLIVNQQNHMAIALAALPVGFDEDKFVVELAKQPGAHVDGQITVQTAGGTRQGVRLSSAINRVPVYEFIVFFPSRVLVMAIVPKSVAAQHGFEDAARQFWANNVVMP